MRENGDASMSDELQYLYLTTNGWRSGSPHAIEIWFVSYAGCYYIVSEKRERSHWVQNIRRNPAVTFRVGEDTFAGTGRIVDSATETDLATAVAALMAAKYGWSDGLIVELTPGKSE